MKKEKPLCHKKTIVAQSRLFQIEQRHLTFSNGVERVYECLKGYHHGSVLMVPVTASGSLILIREYSAGTDRYELGFPKGLIDANEGILEAANREMQEEIGFAARELIHLHSMTLAPGYFGAQMEMVVARDLYPSRLPGDEPEPLEVEEWSLDDMDGLLKRSDFTEARSIAALFLYRDWLSKKIIIEEQR